MSLTELADWQAAGPTGPDLAAAETAAALLMALGIHLDNEHTQKRPRRMARAYAELRATHLCLTARGARARGAFMVTAELRGRLDNEAAMCAEWLHGISSPPAEWEC